MKTIHHISICMLLLILWGGCTGGAGAFKFTCVTELGNDFSLVESDSELIEIYYTCDRKSKKFDGIGSMVAIPTKVFAYGFDDNWIIAKTMKSRGQMDLNCKVFYWIVDKHYPYSKDEDSCKVELKLHTLDSLSYERFLEEAKKRNIKIEWKGSASYLEYLKDLK